MRRYLLALALVLLLAADLGWKAWSERPYIVTGWTYGDNTVTVQYTVPGGGTATSQVRGGAWTAPTGKPPQSCLDTVRVGARIPECVGSWQATFEWLGRQD